jgi:hypothetical protein
MVITVAHGRALACVAALVGCLAQGCAVEPAARAEVSSRDRDAEQWLERYRAGAESLRTADPHAVFVATPRAPCAPLPERRPAGFEVISWNRSSHPMGDDPLFGVAPDVCHFEWDLLQLDPPPASCVTLDAAALDALYARLRELRVDRIRTRRLENASPDRGGYGLVVKWAGARCEIVDFVDSEVEPASDAAFRAALEAFRAAHEAGRRPSTTP